MKYEMESPWQQIHGKISRRRTHIVWAQNAYGTRFTQLRNKRASTPSASEIATRAKFKQAAQQTNTIMMDVSQLTPYRTAWRSAVQSGTTRYKTLRGYVFAQIYNTL